MITKGFFFHKEETSFECVVLAILLLCITKKNKKKQKTKKNSMVQHNSGIWVPLRGCYWTVLLIYGQSTLFTKIFSQKTCSKKHMCFFSYGIKTRRMYFGHKKSHPTSIYSSWRERCRVALLCLVGLCCITNYI